METNFCRVCHGDPLPRCNDRLSKLVISTKPGRADAVEPLPLHELIRCRVWELGLEYPKIAGALHQIAPLKRVLRGFGKEFSCIVGARSRSETIRESVFELGLAHCSV